jgi:MFS family permease
MMEDYKPVLKNKNFVYIWTSQILSQLTINVMNFVLLTKLFEMTGSTIATSLMWVAYALPVIFIGPFAYTVVDMIDKRKLLIITNFLQALVIFIYAISHKTTFFLMYGVVIMYSLLNQFYVPAEASTLPKIIKKEFLHLGNSLFFITQQASLIIGFGVAGFLLNLIGFEKTLFLSSLLVFIAFIAVTFLPKMIENNQKTGGLEISVTDFFGRILEGYRFIKGNRYIMLPFILIASLQVALAVIVINVPVMAQDILGVSLGMAGANIVVPAGIGAAIGALIIPKLIKRGWRKKQLIEYALLFLGVFLSVFAFIVPLLPEPLRATLGFGCISLLGLFFISIIVPSQTFLQEATPGGMRGRVFGNFWFLITLATIFPTIFSGTITEIFGVKVLLFLLSLVTLTGYFISTRYGQKIIEDGKI